MSKLTDQIRAARTAEEVTEALSGTAGALNEIEAALSEMRHRISAARREHGQYAVARKVFATRNAIGEAGADARSAAEVAAALPPSTRLT